MNKIEKIKINGVDVNPWNFSVRFKPPDELRRVFIASSEFLGLAGVVDEYSSNLDSGYNPCPSVTIRSYEEYGDKEAALLYFGYDHRVFIKIRNHEVRIGFDENICAVKLCKEEALAGWTAGGHFACQEGVALGRFLGQGLEIVPTPDVPEYQEGELQEIAKAVFRPSDATPDFHWEFVGLQMR